MLNFTAFAFGDPGSNLTISYLVSHGYRPVIDFGYHYGLLAILANMAWSQAVPLAPVGYQAASILCQFGVVCAIARIATALAFTPLQRIFLFVAIGRAVMPTYWNWAHALEAVLICFAVAEQARGARANALALAAAAIFAKPSMGFVYAALLLMLMATDLNRRRTFTATALFNEIKLAAIVGISLCLVLGVVFGTNVLVRTVIPISGFVAYRAQHMGFFFGTGRGFWHPAHASWRYYAGSMIGLWATATAYLIWGSIEPARRIWENAGTVSDSIKARRDEIVISCAVLHVTFILLFFGGSGSWNYYSYLLIAGVAAVSIERRLFHDVLCALIAIAAGTYYGVVRDSISAWRRTSRSPVTANLWSSFEVQDEWSRILALSKGRRAAVLDYAGGIEVMYPQFEQPTHSFFIQGQIGPEDIRREVARIESADVIVVPTAQMLSGFGSYASTPETELALASFKQTERGNYFSVYQRAR
jgi:hypothetical protein